jgi:hypothetical protein
VILNYRLLKYLALVCYPGLPLLILRALWIGRRVYANKIQESQGFLPHVVKKMIFQRRFPHEFVKALPLEISSTPSPIHKFPVSNPHTILSHFQAEVKPDGSIVLKHLADGVRLNHEVGSLPLFAFMLHRVSSEKEVCPEVNRKQPMYSTPISLLGLLNMQQMMLRTRTFI